MADTSGEKKKETLADRLTREQTESKSMATDIGKKDADIAKRKGDIEKKRAEIEKMIAELESAEAEVGRIAEERDNLKIQKGIKDGKAMLTGALLGIKKAFDPIVQGFKDRIENVKQVTSDMQNHRGAIGNRTEAEVTKVNKGYMRQSKASDSKIINLRIAVGKEQTMNNTLFTHDRAQTRLIFNTVKNYFQAIAKSRSSFTEYKREDNTSLETKIKGDFEDLREENAAVMGRTGRSIMARKKIEQMRTDIERNVRNEAEVARGQNDTWQRDQEEASKGKAGKSIIKGVHKGNLKLVDFNEKRAQFGLKARIALARLGAALGINEASKEFIDTTARDKAAAMMGEKTSKAVNRNKSFGAATVEIDNDIVGEMEQAKIERDKRRNAREQRRTSRRESREDTTHGAKVWVLEVLSGQKDPLKNVKEMITGHFKGMLEQENKAYAKTVSERCKTQEQPAEKPKDDEMSL